jgi:hypothetical protein
VKLRKLARWCAPAVLSAALTAAGPASTSHAVLSACAAGGASTEPPTGPAAIGAPGACRADTSRTPESSVSPQALRETSTPGAYHHLGAGTSGEWAGVSGRVSVVDGSVRPGTYDFVAGRFMVKRDMGAGDIAWLEAGWAETGWAGAGRQHVYTFNTNTKTWQFYDQYAIKAGDRLWIDIHGDVDGVWGAWLWWNNRWNLLTAQKLPIGASAYVEQYVEVHVADGSSTRVDVPTVTVDNVQLKPAGGGPGQYWRADVPTLTGTGPAEQQRTGGFCLNWINPYDTWTAGDCSDVLGGLIIAKPAPVRSGEAGVVKPPDSGRGRLLG